MWLGGRAAAGAREALHARDDLRSGHERLPQQCEGWELIDGVSRHLPLLLRGTSLNWRNGVAALKPWIARPTACLTSMLTRLSKQ